MSEMTPSGSRNGATRREFLTRTAMAAGAAAVASAGAKAISFRSSDPVPKAKPRPPLRDGETIKIGVIGVGGPGGCAMGHWHCMAFTNFNSSGKEKVEVVAISDVNQLFLERSKKEIEKAQGTTCDTYTDYHELLARGDLHGVLAAVPEHWHSKIGIDTIAAGKDLYLEKPMTLNLKDAVALHNAAAANPEVMVQIGTQMTRLPKYHEARQLIQSGAIGTPTFSQTSYCRNSKNGEWHYTIDPAWKPGVNLDWETWCGPLGSMPWDPKVYYQWRRYRKTSTGIIGDLLVHVMTPMVMALQQGWPVRVAATGAHLVDKAMENHDNINIAAQFETGHQMMVAGSTCNQVGLETMIRGHKGTLYLGGRHCELRPEPPYVDEIEPETVECPDIGNDQDVHRLGWLESIRSRNKPESDTELGLRVMVIVDLATRSMWEGKAYAFDPETLSARAI